MTSDLEIYRAAQATIQAYGDGAGLHAARRPDELLAVGHMEGRRVCATNLLLPLVEGVSGKGSSATAPRGRSFGVTA